MRIRVSSRIQEVEHRVNKRWCIPNQSMFERSMRSF